MTIGLRQRELLGLKWSDLDWLGRSLHIRRQLMRKRGGGFTFSEPKTKAGRRTVILGPITFEKVKKHSERLQQERIIAGDQWQENNLMFPSKVGTPIDPCNLYKRFRKLTNKAGLPGIRFHDLRHTAASIMLSNGVAPNIVSRRLGHSKPSVTLDIYGHLIPGMQREVADLMDVLVAPIQVEFAP